MVVLETRGLFAKKNGQLDFVQSKLIQLLGEA